MSSVWIGYLFRLCSFFKPPLFYFTTRMEVFVFEQQQQQHPRQPQERTKEGFCLPARTHTSRRAACCVSVVDVMVRARRPSTHGVSASVTLLSVLEVLSSFSALPAPPPPRCTYCLQFQPAFCTCVGSSNSEPKDIQGRFAEDNHGWQRQAQEKRPVLFEGGAQAALHALPRRRLPGRILTSFSIGMYI